METIIIEEDIPVFGKEVTAFPAGIGEAFDELIQQTGDAAGERNYYGVSYADNNGKMIYKAFAEEKYNGEALKFDYETSTITKGNYCYTTVRDWRSKTNCINQVFQEIMQSDAINKKAAAVEWYKSDDEMLCMVQSI